MSDSLRIKSLFRSYEVNFIGDFTQPLRGLADQHAFFIIDAIVWDIYKAKLKGLIPDGRLLIVEANENNKSLEKCREIIETLVVRKVRRNEKLVAIGGGIIQDVTAFSASIIYRGIEWAFFPTTLLAQADSCIGSKTSINLGNKKNLIGNFYPPTDVYIDKAFLDTLSVDDIKSGIGEILHFFMIANSPLLTRLVDHYDELLSSPRILKEYIIESLNIKRKVVEIDEYDRNERNVFNYGHTFGHAIETVSQYSVNHGQAVTMGMDIANYISLSLKKLENRDFEYMHKILLKNMPLFHLSADMIEDYFTALSKDKKNIGETLGCILSSAIGTMEKVQIPLDDKLKKYIIAYFKIYGSEKSSG